MFLRARRWSVGACAFHIQLAKRTLRMSTFVLPFAEIVLLLCDKMVWLALLTEHRSSGAWTSPLLPTGVPSVIVLVRIGQSRRWHHTVWHQPVRLHRAQVTDSQKPISTVMSVCHPYSNVDNTGCLGIVSSMFLLVFLMASVNKTRKFEKIKEQYRT